MRSITLSWPQPEQPNGIILDYELRYYEKVSRICTPDVSNAVGSRPATVSSGGNLTAEGGQGEPRVGYGISTTFLKCPSPPAPADPFVSRPYPQDHNEYNSSMARSQTNTARIEGLRPGMVYVVQVRARTVAGYGKYSGKMCFQTLTDGERVAGVQGGEEDTFPAAASGSNWIK